MWGNIAAFASVHETVTSSIVGGISGLITALVISLFSHISARATARSIVDAAQKQADATISAATTQAAATRDAAFRNAFETERMKLRFELARQYLGPFHERARQTLATLMEAPANASVAHRLVTGNPHSPFMLCLLGEIVSTQRYWEPIQKVADRFCEHYSNAAALVDKLESHPHLDPSVARMSIIRNCAVAAAFLRSIIAAVDVAIEVRASQIDPPAAVERVGEIARSALEEVAKFEQAHLRELAAAIPAGEPADLQRVDVDSTPPIAGQ